MVIGSVAGQVTLKPTTDCVREPRTELLETPVSESSSVSGHWLAISGVGVPRTKGKASWRALGEGVRVDSLN